MRTAILLDRSGFDALLAALADRGYTVVGPTKGDHSIVYGPVAGADDLPAGWTMDHEAGSSRLHRREDEALFGYAVGQDSWKKYTFPPTTTLVEIRSVDGTPVFAAPEPEAPRYAFIGVRACELAALTIQDRVFLESGTVDRTYAARRAGSLVVAVNCAVAGGTCFCVSMGAGPRCESGFDLALTELIDGDAHEFVIEAGSETGTEILASLPGREAGPEDIKRVDAVVERTASQMGRKMETEGLRDVLLDNPESPVWDEIANLCLACANCTMVCPTCFCSTVRDEGELDGMVATRARLWDSCFTESFSGLHRVPVRASTRSRYRQWMTHKLATWHDQFGTSGCVGCGRCITWCPVGIDITMVVRDMRREGAVA